MLTLERTVPHYVKTDHPSRIVKATPIAPYEYVSFDLERMADRLDTEFVAVPKFDNTKDLINWIENGTP